MVALYRSRSRRSTTTFIGSSGLFERSCPVSGPPHAVMTPTKISAQPARMCSPSARQFTGGEEGREGHEGQERGRQNGGRQNGGGAERARPPPAHVGLFFSSRSEPRCPCLIFAAAVAGMSSRRSSDRKTRRRRIAPPVAAPIWNDYSRRLP